MSSAMIATKCNKCGHHEPEMWVTRDYKGNLSLEGVICGNCGVRNCLTRDWQESQISSYAPPAEDGNINRFEYTFRDENGKKHTKKLDPKNVENHFKKSEQPNR